MALDILWYPEVIFQLVFLELASFSDNCKVCNKLYVGLHINDGRK